GRFSHVRVEAFAGTRSGRLVRGDLRGPAAAGRPLRFMSPGIRFAAYSSSFTYAQRPPGHAGARLRTLRGRCFGLGWLRDLPAPGESYGAGGGPSRSSREIQNASGRCAVTGTL